jgi:alpha,alpha-trehalase
VKRCLAAVLIFGLWDGGAAAAGRQDAPQPPSIEFGDLYRAVELGHIYPDQKTFADAIPRQPPAAILAKYGSQKDRPGFSLKAFVKMHFALPAQNASTAMRPARESVGPYIDRMWTALERRPDKRQAISSLLPLCHPYIVPGGRFREIYYWDSYFTMLGLEQDGRHALARDMLQNIASLIRRHGHMPNGNRSYYLSRSQPPFFASMVELIARRDGDKVYRTYLPELQAEYDYWMEGAGTLGAGTAHRHVVRLRDGTLLNRYWDDRDVPRDESYSEDVETARRFRGPAAEVYRNLRAGSETGWDFSSRWLIDPSRLSTIRTTAIAPVDLNSLMMHLEQVLAKAYAQGGDTVRARLYQTKARVRGAAIRRLMWDGKAGLFTDYLWQTQRQGSAYSLATVYPLYFGAATEEQARTVAETLRDRFLKPGGLETTLVVTGQQWDGPNGWAPLEYLAIEGLKKYRQSGLATEIATRWIKENVRSFNATGMLVEKYDVQKLPARGKTGGGKGGEYPLQTGFGWTNGVLATLMAEYPQASPTRRQREKTR